MPKSSPLLEALETRTLLAANVTIDFTTQYQTIRGLGGDAARVVWAKDTAATDPVGNFVTDNLAHTVMRVGLPWKQWEPTNDDADPAHVNAAGFVDAGKVHSTFQYLQTLKAKGISQIIGTAWEAPDWMLVPATNPLGGPTHTIRADLYAEAAESLTALLVRARDVYGVTIPYLSFNESNFGIQIYMDSGAMAKFIATSGQRFAAAGLPTKWLVGDTFSTKSLVDYAKPILADAAARPYLGPISYHSWWSETEPDTVFTAIADLAKQYGKEVWSPEVGYDALLGKNQPAFATWDNALRLAKIYNRVLKQSRATVALYWEYQVVGGGDVNDFPLASADLKPYPAYYVLKQLSDDLVPGAKIVKVGSDNASLMTLAARDSATGNSMVQVINTGGTASTVTLHGLPAGATFKLLRDSATQNGVNLGTFKPGATGDLTLTLPASSVSVLTTRGVPQATPTPFGGTPFAIPASGAARLQAENFDNGGEGVAYHDLEAANVGGAAAYRPGTGVDLEPATDTGGGYAVDYAKAGEWLNYTVNVAAAGKYTLDFRLANAQPTGGAFHLEVDGRNVTGTLTAPNTGGWQRWAMLTRTIDLPAGKHSVRLAMERNGSWGYVANFNWIRITRAPVPVPAVIAPAAAAALSLRESDMDWLRSQTRPSPPPARRDTFGRVNELWNALAARAEVALSPAQHEQLGRYLDLLLAANQRMNLTRIADRAAAEVQHVGDALTLLPFLPKETHRVVDVGSGGGVPGIPLAVARPDAKFVLLEATKKKAAFLQETVAALGLANVKVVAERAEIAGRSAELREARDVAVARAVGTLDFLVEWCLPLVKRGGKMLAMKGARVAEELPAAAKAIRLLGGGEPVVHPVDLPGTEHHVIVEIPKVAATNRLYPRDPTVAKGKAIG